MKLPSERHFSAGLADKLERASATLSAEAFRLYLLGLLIADPNGRMDEAEVAAIIHEVLLDPSIEVGWTLMPFGTIVWARHPPNLLTPLRVGFPRSAETS